MWSLNQYMKLLSKEANPIFRSALKLNPTSILFVFLNLVVVALGFIRSLYLGNVLGFSDLGHITLIQTGAMLIGLLHFGLLSGGFRVLAMKQDNDFDIINNTVITFFIILFCVLIVGITIGYIINLYSQFIVVSSAILIGFFSLMVSWISAVQFSKSHYLHNNVFNLISYLVSFLFILVWSKININLAIIAFLVQPFIFLLLSANYIKNFNFSFRYDILSGILKIGFVTYLTTVLGLIYIQIERWTINAFLGVEALGNLYLMFIVVSLWGLIPSSINNLFFPSASRAYEDKKILIFKSVIKKNLLILGLYSLLMTISILFLLKPVTALVFKHHLPFTIYVYWALPGLVLKTISDGYYLLLTTTLKLRTIFKLDMFSIIFYSVCVGLIVYAGSVTLVNLIMCFNLYCLFRFTYLFISFKSQINIISKFY